MSLVDSYDAALFDLDGVIYLGPVAVDGAAEGVAALVDKGKRIGYVTNNAARAPQVVVDHLNSLGVPAERADVVTSSQASARMLARDLPSGAKVLVVGAQALADEVAAVGLEPVWSFTEQPVAVVQGYDPAMEWPRLDAACQAIQQGAVWYATNTDLTRPTDQGLVPGAGAQLAAVQVAVQSQPLVAGKPFPPLLEETMRRMGTTRCIFVGDRIDTDIMGARAVGIDSLFVFTGAHGIVDLLAADQSGRPTHIGWDLRELQQPVRDVQLDDTGATCRGQSVRVAAGELELPPMPADRQAQLDLLWAVLQLVWSGRATAGPELARAFDQLH